MPASHPSTTPARIARSARSERGLGLVEIIAVVAIIMVLLAIVTSSFRGTKRTTHYKAAQSAASSYAEAIEAYMADNGQRPPALGGAEWPAASRAQKIGGPIDVMLKTASGQPKRYLPRAAPEAVSDGLVDLIRPSETAASTAQAWITYSVTGSDYLLLVEARQVTGEAKLQCGLTNGVALPSGVERCA